MQRFGFITCSEVYSTVFVFSCFHPFAKGDLEQDMFAASESTVGIKEMA